MRFADSSWTTSGCATRSAGQSSTADWRRCARRGRVAGRWMRRDSS
jgi:hypothetical protein